MLVVEANPLPLPARERGITSTVALGLSNTDIADRRTVAVRTVAVRTVEGYICRTCTKLNVPDREPLARTTLTGGGTPAGGR